MSTGDRGFPSQPNLPATVDAGKVRLGGFAPTLPPTADAGKVRLGGFAPALPPPVRP